MARLYLIEILHQTTTISSWEITPEGCILSKFYIKPQRCLVAIPLLLVVSYRNSTSNHNILTLRSVSIIVVSYRNSTSNHNLFATDTLYNTLYLIEILHQTTTGLRRFRLYGGCILSKFYIKPQQTNLLVLLLIRCILSKFYIKPQLFGKDSNDRTVVSYRNSTSNHNVGPHID